MDTDNFLILVQELEDFLLSADYLTVSIPEIDLLRKYSSDARSCVCHVHNVLQNLNNREDYGNIVIELSNIFKAGELLRVQGSGFQDCLLCVLENNSADYFFLLLTMMSQFVSGPVDELSLVEAELKRSRCRENASKVSIILWCTLKTFFT